MNNETKTGYIKLDTLFRKLNPEGVARLQAGVYPPMKEAKGKLSAEGTTERGRSVTPSGFLLLVGCLREGAFAPTCVLTPLRG